MEYCDEHREHESRIKRNEGDIQDLWRHINTMKAWVIAGMMGLLTQLIMTIVRMAG